MEYPEKNLSFETARKICLVKTLAKLGHLPTKTSEKQAWFLSPFRSETQASFNVSLSKNLWYDFGLGKGGTTIDLIMELKSCSEKEALDFLKDDMEFFTFRTPKTNPSKKNLSTESKLQITEIGPLQHPALLRYIYSRRIPVRVSRKYCSQVSYRYQGKQYYAVGLRNTDGGWELRNKYLKNSSSPKTYSFIQNDSSQLIITEGMFDFLSLATLEESVVNTSDAIILNSLAFVDRIKPLLPNYGRVLLFLDNDSAGNKATDSLLHLDDVLIKDCSDFYSGYEDLNEKLINERS
ncbi:toprim domain-containing protein [Algoriphagus sp.]|uniref:toprim domain-containing protein n=1 Tax=Algoriphagus sp. TaxID=1872435 RepID=UPI00260AA27A|nr:toprim domain-containing protein [Algoriphagus sp.]